MKLRASALTYSLVVTLLVTLLLASLLLLHGYTRTSIDMLHFEELAMDNLESGRNLVLYGEPEVFGRWSESLFNSELDSFEVESKPWGLLGLMHARGVHGAWTAEETMLFGARPEREFAASLFLADEHKPLTLAGETRLSGPLYVPRSGIRKGYVGRDGFKGENLYEGEKHSSEGIHLEARYDHLSETQEWLQQVWDGRFGEGDATDSLVGKWNAEPLQIRQGRLLRLQERVSGHVVLIAPEIEVTAEATIEDALLFARTIIVREGFKGRLQAFATDTLVVEESCQLRYPSVVMVSNPDGKGSLAIHHGATIEGMVVNDAAFLQGKEDRGEYTLLESGAEVVGTVYAPHNLDVQGKVTGTVVTHHFILRTPSAVYENHLFNCEIGRSMLHPNYAMGLIDPLTTEYVLIRKLK